MLCFHTVFAWVSHDLEQYSHIIAKESEVIFYKLLMASSSWRWRYYAPPKYRSLRMFTIRHSITSENTRVFIWSAVWTSDLEKRPMFEYHRLKKKGCILHPGTGHEGPDGGGGGIEQCHAPVTLSPGQRPGTHCTGGWVGPNSSLDGCRRSWPIRDTIAGSSSP